MEKFPSLSSIQCQSQVRMLHVMVWGGKMESFLHVFRVEYLLCTSHIALCVDGPSRIPRGIWLVFCGQ